MSFKMYTISKRLKELKINHFHGNQLNKLILKSFSSKLTNYDRNAL